MSKTEFKNHRRISTAFTEIRPYKKGEELANVTISDVARATGSPKVGDKIARNPENYADQWLLTAAYFKANYKRVT